MINCFATSSLKLPHLHSLVTVMFVRKKWYCVLSQLWFVTSLSCPLVHRADLVKSHLSTSIQEQVHYLVILHVLMLG